MAPWKTIFPYKQVVFRFHVSFRECIVLVFLIIFAFAMFHAERWCGRSVPRRILGGAGPTERASERVHPSVW